MGYSSVSLLVLPGTLRIPMKYSKNIEEMDINNGI